MVKRKMTPQEIADWNKKIAEQKRWTRIENRRQMRKGFLWFLVLLVLVFLIMQAILHVRIS
jgi:hypothetical protein